MRVSLFFHLGQFVYRFRSAIIVLWLVTIIGCIPLMSHLVAPFNSTGFVAANSESELTNQFINQKIGYNENRFIILYHSSLLKTTNPLYLQKIKQSLAGLKDFSLSHDIIYPNTNPDQISKDKHTAYVVVLFKQSEPLNQQQLKDFKAKIKVPAEMTMDMGGEGIFIESVNKQTQQDLYHADAVATPVSVIILLLVFGTVIAALIPIVLGGGCAFIILTLLYVLGYLFSLSIFTLNIALLLGLCLSLDYALFIVNRFRDELSQNNTVAQAIAITLATAGKAVFFSGLAVFISLSALLLFPINILFSVGIGGLTAVFIAVAIAITLLPAVLAVLKNGVNRFAIYKRIPDVDRTALHKSWQFWHHLAIIVAKRPVFFFFGSILILLLLGYPFLHAKFGISDFNVLPKKSESRQFFEHYQQQFNTNELEPILLVISTHGNILSRDNINTLYKFANQLQKNPLIAKVQSIVTTSPRLPKDQYATLYNTPYHLLPHEIQLLLKTTTRKHVTIFSIISQYDGNAQETRDLVKQLQTMNPGKGLTLHLTGSPVNNVDVFAHIATQFPYAVCWILLLTYVVLLVLLRSIFLPLKAIIMTILSLCASYGVLVFIFQDGHFHHLLNFEPQGMLDISLLIIIFCALFGFSMDYEVFLLTRIHEYYKTTHHNRNSVIFGIVKSSRIITSAAIIVICICGSFMVADVIMVKEFGLGIAVAIFVDAFIIRTFLVPATMILVKKWNWYLPRFLDKILPNSKSR